MNSVEKKNVISHKRVIWNDAKSHYPFLEGLTRKKVRALDGDKIPRDHIYAHMQYAYTFVLYVHTLTSSSIRSFIC